MAQFWPPVPTDSGWVTPVLNAGWSPVVGEIPAYRLLNGVLVFRGRANSTGSNVDAFTLDASFRPPIQSVGLADNGGSPMRCIVRPDGRVGQVTAAVASGLSFADFPQVYSR